MSVKLVNESALGIHSFTWKAKNGRNEIAWCDGMDAPAFSFFSTTLGRMLPPIPIRNPQRFGWKAGKQTTKTVKAFAQSFADVAEAES